MGLAAQDDRLREASARPTRRALAIINSKAAQGGQSFDGILERLRNGGLAIEVCNSIDPQTLSDDIIKRKAEIDCVLVFGGDGTANCAARGLMETQLPLGLLPTGTANDLARTLGIPQKLETAADIIVGGRTREIDLGTVNGHPFFNVASLGLSVDLARGLNRDTKRQWGRLAYALAAIRVLLRARRFTAWISNEQQRLRVKTLQIAVGNGRHYGGGNVIAETAEIDDGRLELYSLELRSLLRLVLMLPWFRFGMHGTWSEVRTERATAFTIETRRPQAINADGELVTQTPAKFQLCRKAIDVYVP